MKKLISLALALSMALTMAACGNTGKQPSNSGTPNTGSQTTSGSGSQDTSGSGSQTPAFVPERDITLVNPYEAGGTSDIPSRIYADFISQNMGGRLMNVNCIGGAGGAVGAQEVMNSNPDGYTILVAPAGYAMNYAKGGLD